MLIAVGNANARLLVAEDVAHSLIAKLKR